MTVISTDSPPHPVPTDPSKSNSRLRTFSRFALTSALLIVAATAVAYILLSLPVNDDFVRATLPKSMGYWPYFKHLYLRWQGRWVSYGIEDAILPHLDMIRLYPALLGGLALVDLLALLIVCRRITQAGSRWFSLACTIGLAAMFWNLMPYLSETIDWFVGGLENVTSLALAGTLLAFLVRTDAPGSSRKKSNALPMILGSVAAFLIAGFHESYGAMLCIALATGTLGAYWTRSRNRQVWLIVLIAAVIGLSAVVAAPGNRNRMQGDVANRVRTVHAVLKIAAKQVWLFCPKWFFDPSLIAASLFVAFSPGIEASRPIWPTQRPGIWRMLIPSAWLAMLIVGFLAPSYAFVANMPGRTLSANFLIFASGWLLIVFLFTRDLRFRDNTDQTIGLRSPACSSTALLILAASLVLHGNTLEGIHDLATRKVFRWRESSMHRYALLHQPGPPDRVVPPLAPWSRLNYSGEVWPISPDWHIQDYFGIRSFRVQFPNGRPLGIPTDVAPDRAPPNE